MSGRMVSPDDLLAASKSAMIDGREPASADDWGLLVNFWAANIDVAVAESACQLLCTIYGVPAEVTAAVPEIVRFQKGLR